jgi:hypothetical protein
LKRSDAARTRFYLEPFELLEPFEPFELFDLFELLRHVLRLENAEREVAQRANRR